MNKPKAKGSSNWQEVPSFDEKDILASLEEKKGTSLFLGKFSMAGVFAVLKKRGFFKDAQKRKLWPLEFDLDSSQFPLQRFRVFCQKKQPENMIVDLKIKEGTFRPPKTLSSSFPFSDCHLLILEWLTLQNPFLSFTEEKTPLPGQKYPGLNLGKKVLDIFIYLARLTKKDGILAFPAYFHNALLFSRYFHFINPEKQGEVLAIKKSFPDISFKQLAWIVYLNCIKDKNGKTYEWMAEEQLYPLNKALKEYFESKSYNKRVEDIQQRSSFEIDWGCFEKKKKTQNLFI